MKLEDFNNIDFKNVGSLAPQIKAVLLLAILLLVLAAGYFVFWYPALEELTQAKEKEQELRKVFLEKKGQAVKIEAYRQQMVEIEKTFGALLKQLPDKSEMYGLLTDINQAGLGRGLEFELFKPGQENVAEFYAELPIQIRVIGNYEDLGAFAADVSKLSRIVTLNDVTIAPMAGAANADGKDNKAPKEGRLVMEAVAKTFRYLDSSELAAKKSAEMMAKKAKS